MSNKISISVRNKLRKKLKHSKDGSVIFSVTAALLPEATQGHQGLQGDPDGRDGGNWGGGHDGDPSPAGPRGPRGKHPHRLAAHG